MSSRSVVSVGLFGRLSILVAPRQDVHKRIQSMSEKMESRKWRALRETGGTFEFPNSPSPAAILAQALPPMLVELSALVETIVLSDEILLFVGYDPEYVNELVN